MKTRIILLREEELKCLYKARKVSRHANYANVCKFMLGYFVITFIACFQFYLRKLKEGEHKTIRKCIKHFISLPNLQFWLSSGA